MNLYGLSIYYLKKTSKFMRHLLILLFVGITQLLAVSASGQNAVIQISSGSLTVGQFLNEVEKQTNNFVIYMLNQC